MCKHVNDVVCYLTPAVLGPKNCNPCYDSLNSLMVKCHNPWTPDVMKLYFTESFISRLQWPGHNNLGMGVLSTPGRILQRQ